MKLLKIQINDSGWCITGIDSIEEFVTKDSQVGDKINIEIIEMTEEEYDNLPEFEGF